MKTYKNLYPRIHTFAHLYWAFRAARCGKRDRVAVAGFEFDLERNLWWLQEELSQQTYQPGRYTNFYVYEPKRRLVSAAPFRDRVVHHALCQVIEPIWEARFIPHPPAMPAASAKARTAPWIRLTPGLNATATSFMAISSNTSRPLTTRLRADYWPSTLPIRKPCGS